MNFALVKDNQVCSIILWDGTTPYEPEEGFTLYEVPEGIAPGWMIVDGAWVAPLPVDIPEPEVPVTFDDPAKLQAALALTALGIAEDTARTIVGLTPIE